MARYLKKYKTYSNETIITIKLGDVSLEAHFVNGNVRDNQWATLETADPIKQFIIEHSNLYGKAIFLDSMIEIEEPKEEEEMKPEDVTTLEQAREYMVKNFGMDKRTVAAPNALKSAMKGHGVEFPNLNI